MENTKTKVEKSIKIYSALRCYENDSAHDIAKKLRDAKERRIFVVDEQEKLIGVITTTDLVTRALAENKCEARAREIMTSPVKHAEMSDDLEKAVEIMNEIKSMTCPISNKGVLKGVVHYKDIVHHIAHSLTNDKR